MEEQKDVIVADRLGQVKTDSQEEYLAHLLCLGGKPRDASDTSAANRMPP